MNYIRQLNVFFDRLAARPLPAASVALYIVLLHISNRAGWPVYLSVPASTLCGLLRLNERTMRRARAALVASGYVQHIPRPGRQAPLYIIKKLYTDTVDNIVHM